MSIDLDVTVDIDLEDWPLSFMLQSEYARHRGVSRKSVTEWKQRGLLVFGGGAGFADMIDVAKTDALLASRPELNRGGVATQIDRVTAPGNSAPRKPGNRPSSAAKSNRA